MFAVFAHNYILRRKPKGEMRTTYELSWFHSLPKAVLVKEEDLRH